jgi:hypothetical protein
MGDVRFEAYPSWPEYTILAELFEEGFHHETNMLA